MLQSISTALCTVNGELCTDDQPLVSGEKPGKSSHAASKSTQTFKIDIFTEEVAHCSVTVESHHSALIHVANSMNFKCFVYNCMYNAIMMFWAQEAKLFVKGTQMVL